MNEHVIKHNIPKSAQGSYYSISFPVPSNVEFLTILYSYERWAGKAPDHRRKVKNIVDLGVSDATGRFLGWSGSARSEISIGEYSSTNGYLMTEIMPGEWSILVGAYKIPEQGLDVCYTIKYQYKSPRWLTGDLHIHSTASDGQHDLHKLIKIAKKRGLDFIAVSNHNNYSENLNLPQVSDFTLIPAVEWTHYKGHMNFFGVKNPFVNSFIANSEAEMLDIVTTAKGKGAVVSVCHPKCSLCPYLWDNDDCFDVVEVWNGPMRKDNMNAASWWHKLLLSKRGKAIPIIGGSDYHRTLHPVRLGYPITRVWSESPSFDDILRALRNGHSFITASANGVVLDLRCGDNMMGDTVKSDAATRLIIKASRLKPGMVLELVSSDGVTKSWMRFNKGSFEASVAVEPTWEFAYLNVVRAVFGKQFIRAITNPIYFI